MTAQRLFSRVIPCLVAMLVLVVPGCASMTSSQEELRSIGEKEGVVVGSVLLTAEQAASSGQSSMAFLGGWKAADLKYAVSMSEAGAMFKQTYSLPATPGKEEFFVKKLPAGQYRMDSIAPTGFMAPTALSFPLSVPFTVKPGEISYIGRLVVRFPERLSAGSRFGFGVQDAQQETLEKLKAEHPVLVTKVQRNLAGGDPAANLVPGNTVASQLLQRDTLTVITAMDSGYDNTCATRTVINTESLVKPAGLNDSGEERWTVDRCGKSIHYRVTFRPSARGGIDISVVPEK